MQGAKPNYYENKGKSSFTLKIGGKIKNPIYHKRTLASSNYVSSEQGGKPYGTQGTNRPM